MNQDKLIEDNYLNSTKKHQNKVQETRKMEKKQQNKVHETRQTD
jgi:hypothetical protein